MIDGATRQLPYYGMTDAIGQRPIVLQPLILGNSERKQGVRQRGQIRFLRVEDDVIAVPILNLEICDDLRADAVDRYVPALAELFPPIFEGLLVDVMFAALTGDCSREHHERSMRRQRTDKF